MPTDATASVQPTAPATATTPTAARRRVGTAPLSVVASQVGVRAADADVLTIGVLADGGLASAADADVLAADTLERLAEADTSLRDLLRVSRFAGRSEQTLWVVPTIGAGVQAATLLLVGLGDRDRFDDEALRRAAAVVVKEAAGATRVATTIASAAVDPLAAARVISEAAVLAAYRYDRYKTTTAAGGAAAAEQPAPRLERLEILLSPGIDPAAAQQAVRTGLVRARATNLARDLSNTPPNDLHPADLAAAAEQAVSGRGVRVRVLEEADLEEGGFGGILGVGQGAAHPPRLVELVYEPEQPAGHVVLVGKGITFDSGGLSLKPRGSMVDEKTDMAGAAAVAAVMSALADLDVKLKVTGYLAIAENMPSGTALRPGDVLTLRNGTTVEVLNTDAEGRLVLGDALALAAESDPDAIVDVATLTGACVVALGPKYTGMISNDDALAGELLAAAADAGEPTWPLPLAETYRKALTDGIADLKNVTKVFDDGAALHAGLFLKEFVDGRPWAHLDIAGPARSDAEDGDIPKGSTGAAVRTLLSWLAARSQRARARG